MYGNLIVEQTSRFIKTCRVMYEMLFMQGAAGTNTSEKLVGFYAGGSRFTANKFVTLAQECVESYGAH